VLGGDALSENKEFLGVDGTLIARSKVNFFDHYSAELIEFEPVVQGDPEIFQIRGYKPKRVEENYIYKDVKPNKTVL